MAIEDLSEDILLVTLAPEQKISDQLSAANSLVTRRKDCHVIIDFSRIQVITSVNISNLIILYQLLKTNGYRLIFCNVSFVTKCIFRVIGLRDVFSFVVDKPAALEALQQGATNLHE